MITCKRPVCSCVHTHIHMYTTHTMHTETYTQRDIGKGGSLLLCPPRVRWPQSQHGALCLGATFPCPDVGCPALEECLVHGWHGALLAVRMTQIPSWRLPAQAAQAVPLACVDGAGASLSRMEARKRGVCVSTLSPLSLSRHRGGAGRLYYRHGFSVLPL